MRFEFFLHCLPQHLVGSTLQLQYATAGWQPATPSLRCWYNEWASTSC